MQFYALARNARTKTVDVVWACLFAGVIALGGCASYERLPLETRSKLVAKASDLEAGGDRRLTLASLDRLIVANNPDLRAARARLGVAQAQVLQSGILPNPQLALSYPFLAGGPGTQNAYSAAIGQDVKSILLLKTKGEVAENSRAEISATLLWQEWQIIGKARLLFVDIVSSERAKTLIVQNRKILQERFNLTNTAIGQGNATLATLSPDLLAVGDIQKTYDDLDRLQLSRRHQLNALLGLVPEANLVLVASPNVPRVKAATVLGELATLADRRPDLIALQYGYRSEDAKVRQAVLAQFPNLSVGVIGGRDTTGVLSVGPQLTVDLPIFDRNQGAIAIEQSTREQLRREFSARLAAATGEIGALLSEQALLERQLAALEPRLKEARNIAERTEVAFKQGTFDERAYVDIQVARLAREQERAGLQQAMLEGQIGLATLVGAGFPSVQIEPEGPPADPLGLLRWVGR